MAVSHRQGARTRIGDRYVVETKLGEGGMGAVFRVRDDANGRTLALKQLVFAPDVPLERRVASQLRFRREFHTMASLAHPRIVSVFDYGVDEGTPYYTMELLDGQDLADLDRVPAQRACALLRDVASALAFLHARRLLHRDLAPRNVRCTSTGDAKLIDFGVLATTGMNGDIAGTPPLIAPEALQGRPLDHRYDLYGLGALAYRVLTGKHAFPARDLDGLQDAWRAKPPDPSTLAAGIPPGLDELVLSLMSPDPLARPASAAEVIDRLTAIADLDPLPELETSRGWIASAALIGRQNEVQHIRKSVARAHDGEGRSLLIEAPSGTGKSRMLRELALQAQLAGMTVVRADSDAAQLGPYGIVHELARGLFSVVPDAAKEASEERAPILARVITELRELYTPAKPLGDPAEDRLQLQDELCAFFLDVAKNRSIALVVDDLQRCDEASAAVLASLAYDAPKRRLLVAGALRTDEAIRARAPLAALAEVAQRLRLRGLEQNDVLELCRSLFGDAAHIPRLAQWMHKTAGGSPLYAMELARHLVDRGVIRYERGLWTIPESLANEVVPRGLADAMDARVRALPPAARALGEALSIHGKELPLELIMLLAESRDERAVFAALDQLAYEEVLIFNGASWRFRHDGLREAMLRGLDPTRRAALHRRVGEALVSIENRRPELDDEIGWHLLRGGDREKGAELLERAGRALYNAQSFSDCIAPLEAALEVLTERDGSARTRLEILAMLVTSGTFTDREAAMRHIDACVQGYQYWAGVDVMAKVRRYVGRSLAILFGLTWALLRWIFTPRRGPNPYEAFRTYFVTSAYSTSVYSLMFDTQNVEKMLRAIDPIATFRHRVPYAVYLLTRNLLDYPRGEVGAVRRQATQILDILANDHLTPMRDIDRRAFAGAAHYMLALVAVSEVDPQYTKVLDELAKVQMRFFDIGAENARAIFHRMRGEEEAALQIESRVEQLFVQLGSVWQMEAFLPIVASLAYAFARDTIGLRRSIDQLSRQILQGFRFRPFLDLARGEYLREHGDLVEARAAIEASMKTDIGLVRIAALPALAETLLALGEVERACEVAFEGIKLGTDADHGNVHGKLRSVRALALGEAALGQPEVAGRRLDEAIAEAKPRNSPLLSGSLHEARARVAFTADDWTLYRFHAVECERYFRAASNPVLVAHAERLGQLARRRTTSTPAPGTEVNTAVRGTAEARSIISEIVTAPARSDVSDWVSARLAGCRTSSERAQRLLDMLLVETRAGTGYLFVRDGNGMLLAAPAFGDEPDSELVDRARKLLDPDLTVEVREASEASSWRLLPLPPAPEQPPVACVAVRAGAMSLADVDSDLLREVARRLTAAT